MKTNPHDIKPTEPFIIVGRYYNSENKQSWAYPRLKKSKESFSGKITFMGKLSSLTSCAKIHESKYKPPTKCCFCHKKISPHEYRLGSWVWPNNMHHMVFHHDVIPDADFVKWVMRF